jgi:ubiquinone/menaquinone biosynthesis C-methylase UbiE
MAEAWFWDRIAKKYAKMPIADASAYQTKLDKTREYFTPESVVLEFGCGTGNTALKHAPYVAHIDAIDVSAGMLAQCQQRLQNSECENVTFHHATIESFQTEPAHYDVVLAMSILHLVDDTAQAVSKVYELLKPGGYFISSTVCTNDSFPWLRWIAKPGRALRLLPRIHCFHSAQLIQCLSKAGFQLEHQWQPKVKAAVFIIAKKPE